MAYKLMTSESVTEGHPDKVCDQISDAILDEILRQDPNARVACDIAVNTGLVLVMGEITCESYVDFNSIVRSTLKEIGYTDARMGFDYNSCAVLTSIDEQSPDISMGVSHSLEFNDTHSVEDTLGAGDQGMVFGYACDETPELMPLPITLAHAITRELARIRKDGQPSYLRPDGKAQVTVAYQDGIPQYVHTAVVSAQHDESVTHSEITRDMTEVIRRVIPAKYLRPDTRILVNPTGKFVVGGPMGDSGLTGRKIIVDTYGGYCPHGGGAFSGKDPTKVDRSAAYYARYICKNVVKAGMCKKIQLEMSYAIGVAQPVAVNVNTFGTSRLSDEAVAKIIGRVFDMRPYSIIKSLNLRAPIYAKTAKNGHFGNPDFPWEQTDKADILQVLSKEY